MIVIVEKMNFSLMKLKLQIFGWKYEVTWDEYELWMINLDKDNREYNQKTADRADTLSDAVTETDSPLCRHEFWNGQEWSPCYLYDSTFS